MRTREKYSGIFRPELRSKRRPSATRCAGGNISRLPRGRISSPSTCSNTRLCDHLSGPQICRHATAARSTAETRRLEMDYRLEGKLALVTAGAHGIGQAIADLLAGEGARVIVADIDEAALAAGSNWYGAVAADLATADGMASAIDFALQRFGRAPDILINNLGLADA